MPETGAEQMDRAEGVRLLVRLGFDVVVITKVVEWADSTYIESCAHEMGIRVVMVPYRFSNRTLSNTEKLYKFFGKLKHPLYLDGAAYEYSEKGIIEALSKELAEYKPDVVWFEYTYLWPLYGLVRRAGIPIVTRSLNFEPKHFLEEDGRTLFNYIKYAAKLLGERRCVRMSDVVLAITPKEKTKYERVGAKKVLLLPLRSLPRFVASPRPLVRERTPLHVFFMGSSYRVAHNRAALALVLKEIAPLLRAQAPGEFVLHVLGSKVPEEYKKYFTNDCVYEGYVENLDTFLSTMDVALMPSLMGAGQQQKIFEPLARGIPTITAPRALAGYDFTQDVEYLGATTPQEYTAALLLLRNKALREMLSGAASQKAATLFAQIKLDEVVLAALPKLT